MTAMIYDLTFWNQQEPCDRDPLQIYAALRRREQVPGLVELPVPEILASLKVVFPDFDPGQPLTSAHPGGASFDTTWSNQHFRFRVREGLVEAKNKLIGILSGFGCPLYDAQLGRRYNIMGGDALDRDDWNRRWSSMPHRRLPSVPKAALKIIAPLLARFRACRAPDSATISEVPPEFAARNDCFSDLCPVCGKTTLGKPRLSASVKFRLADSTKQLLPHFGVWIHPSCFARCPDAGTPPSLGERNSPP